MQSVISSLAVFKSWSPAGAMHFSHKQAAHNNIVGLIMQAMSLSWALKVIYFFCQILAQAIRFGMIRLLKFIAVQLPALIINFYWKSTFKVDTARSLGHVLPPSPAVLVQESQTAMRNNLCSCSRPSWARPTADSFPSPTAGDAAASPTSLLWVKKQPRYALSDIFLDGNVVFN